MKRAGVVLGAVAVAGAGLLLSSAVLMRDTPPGEPNRTETYRFDGRDGLITNEYAHWNDTDPERTTAEHWMMTSGSVFRRSGRAWTGPLDDISPDVDSQRTTNSAVFRMFTKRSDWKSFNLKLQYRVLSRLDEQTHDYDGLHILLRAQESTRFYSVSLDRRDGDAVVKRKLPGVDNDPYETLAAAPVNSPMGEWRTAEVRIEDLDSEAVAIDVAIDDQQVLGALDRGLGGRGPLTEPGEIGIRGDNTEFEIASVEVTPI